VGCKTISSKQNKYIGTLTAQGHRCSPLDVDGDACSATDVDGCGCGSGAWTAGSTYLIKEGDAGGDTIASLSVFHSGATKRVGRTSGAALHLAAA